MDLLHCTQVAKTLYDEGQPFESVMAGFLHDSVEDGYLTSGQVLSFDEKVAYLVLSVTRGKGESYDDYITRVAKQGLAAIEIKLADLRHNLSRMDAAHESLRPRYAKAILRLEGARVMLWAKGE